MASLERPGSVRLHPELHGPPRTTALPLLEAIGGNVRGRRGNIRASSRPGPSDRAVIGFVRQADAAP